MAASSAADLVSHIVAASTVLTGLQSVDASTVQAVASAQRQRVEVALQSTKQLNMQDMAALTTAISQSAFPPEHQKSLMRVMAQLSSVSPTKSADSKFQNFEALGNYLPASVVNRRDTPDFTTALLHFVLRLGLRKPSEPTFKELSVLALVGSEGMEKALGFSPETRAGMLESTKLWFRKAAERMPVASPWIALLPQSPKDLQSLHPEHFEALFSADPVKPLDIDPVHLEMLRAGTRCRKPKLGRQFSQTSFSSPGGSSGNNAAVTWQDLRQLMSGFAGPQRSEPPLQILTPPSSSPLARSLLFSPQSQHTLPALPAPPAPGQMPPSDVTQAPEAQVAAAPLALQASELDHERHARGASDRSKLSLQDSLKQIDLAMAEKAERAKDRRSATVMKRPAAHCLEEGDEPKVKIILGHERTRWQYLVRISGHPSKSFVYGKSGNENNAKKDAIAYIKKQCKEFGYPFPANLRDD